MTIFTQDEYNAYCNACEAMISGYEVNLDADQPTDDECLEAMTAYFENKCPNGETYVSQYPTGHPARHVERIAYDQCGGII